MTNASAEERQQALRLLPSVDAALAGSDFDELRGRYRHEYLVRLIREAIDEVRRRLLDTSVGDVLAGAPSSADLAESVLRRLDRDCRRMSRVINATGTIIHTNLGRSLLADAAVEAIERAARSYVSLEYDLEAGARGHRDRIVEDLLVRLTGAETATVVNNNAAAVMIALRVVAEGREVIVSRGELIEIGGAFRIPDVMRAAGASLREVGTTNRTHVADYEDAIVESTALLLKVHPSNYSVQGFTSEVRLDELVEIGQRHGIPVMEDLGSGALIDLGPWGVPDEPVVKDRIGAGADLVTFSGDKLLGGPQAGILVGSRAVIEPIRRHPIMRTVRADKLTYAALAATLDIYERSPDPGADLPMLRLLRRDASSLRDVAAGCAGRWTHLLAGIADVRVEDTVAQIGSGAQPTARLDSVAVTLHPHTLSAEDLASRLRASAVPVISRIERERVWLDFRAVLDDEVPLLDAAIQGIARTFGARDDADGGAT